VWRKAYGKLEALLEGRALEHAWSNLSTAQHEVVCSEFLRGHQKNELPRLKWLLLPPGRTLKDIDIFGIATDGKMLLAQITFLKKRDTEEKKSNLLNCTESAAHLLMFCQCEKLEMEDNVHFVPVEDVFTWLEDNQDYAALCFSGR